MATDWSHREALAKLLRFESSHTEPGKTTSLADYVSRMPEEQKEIYYLLAPSREAAEASPYYEVFREKKFEVLFLTDPRDEFVHGAPARVRQEELVAAEKADLKLDDRNRTRSSDDDARLLANFIKETLGDRVGEVRASKRLVGSPAVVVDSDPHDDREHAPHDEDDEPRRRRRSLEAKPDLEINPDHAMMVRLEHDPPHRRRARRQVAEQIFDNALVAAGLLEDPRAMLARLNSLLERLLSK